VRKFLFVTLALCIAFSLVISGCSSSKKDNSWEEIQKKGEFVVGLDASFPPMGFTENGQIVGFDIDLAKEVCKRLGLNLKLQPIEWDAKELELETKNIDAIWNGFTITDERKEKILFSDPYMKNRQVFVVLEDSPVKKKSDLKGKKLGLQAASSAADALNNNPDFKKELAEVVELDYYSTALMDLEKGGVDAVLMDEVVADYYIQVRGEGYRILDESLATEEYGIGFRKNDKKLMEKIQETLEAMAKDGTVAQISEKWFGKDLTTIGK